MDRHPGQAEVGETGREEDARRVFVSDRTGGAEPDLPPAPGSLGKAFGNYPLPALLSCRELYSQFLREMIIQPGIAKANMGVSREDVTFEDHVSSMVSSGDGGLQGGEGCGL